MMIRKFALSSGVALAALLALAATALAGGVVVSLDADPPVIEPGEA
jgi:hypothetical protein